MKTIKIYSILFLLTFLLFSCKKEVQMNEFKQYIQNEENGLVKSKKISGLTFELSYLPGEIINEENSSQSTKGEKEQDKGYQYFVLKIKDGSNRSPLKSRVANKDDLMNKLYYVQTKLKNDFILKDGDEVMNCVFLNYEDDHNLINEMRMLIAFDSPKNINDLTIEYDDNLFGLGLLKFKIKQSDLQNLPVLKI